MRKHFARIVEASDGYQVVFTVGVNPDSGCEVLCAETPMPDGCLHQHNLEFETPGLADQLLAVVGTEEANNTRLAVLAATPVPTATQQ